MIQPITEVSTNTYFEDILPRTGWGLYYKFMIGMACTSCFTQAAAFFSLPFSIALSTCQNLIGKDIIFYIHASFVLGRAFGGFLICSLCDIFGRKKLLTNTMLLVFLCCFISAFANNYYVITFSSFILASGLEANYCVIRVHLAEVLPLNRRGLYLSMCDLFWSMGYMLVSVFGLFLKDPLSKEASISEMQPSNWRMLFAIAGGLNLILACATALLEESPRFFLHTKNYYLTVLTLKQFYAINKSSYGEYLEMRETDLGNIIEDNPSIYPEPRGCTHILRKTVILLLAAIRKLFSKKYLKTTICLWIVKLPLLIFGILEMNIVTARVSYSAESFIRNGIEILNIDNFQNYTLCHNMTKNETLYYIYFLITIGIVVGIFTVLCFVDLIGRKILSCTSLLLCGAGYVIIFWIENNTVKIVTSTIFMAFYSAATTTVSITAIESYPTSIRCTSWGILNLFGLLSSIIIIQQYHLFSHYFSIIYAILFSGAGVVAYFLHDLNRKPMIE